MGAMADRVGPYLSDLHRGWLANDPRARFKALAASLLFCDISGFTPLTERLVTHGRVVPFAVKGTRVLVEAQIVAASRGRLRRPSTARSLVARGRVGVLREAPAPAPVPARARPGTFLACGDAAHSFTGPVRWFFPANRPKDRFPRDARRASGRPCGAMLRNGTCAMRTLGPSRP